MSGDQYKICLQCQYCIMLGTAIAYGSHVCGWAWNGSTIFKGHEALINSGKDGLNPNFKVPGKCPYLLEHTVE